MGTTSTADRRNDPAVQNARLLNSVGGRSGVVRFFERAVTFDNKFTVTVNALSIPLSKELPLVYCAGEFPPHILAYLMKKGDNANLSPEQIMKN